MKFDYIKGSGLFPALMVLAACGGGGTGNGPSVESFAARFAELSSDPNLNSSTPNATLAVTTGSANYEGIVNMALSSNGYFGTFSMDVDFTSDTFSGSAGNFEQYAASVASESNGSPVKGGFDMSGTLTGNNETVEGGLDGTAIGEIDGHTVDMAVSGSITGLNAEGVRVYFDGDGFDGGTGFGLQ